MGRLPLLIALATIAAGCECTRGPQGNGPADRSRPGALPDQRGETTGAGAAAGPLPAPPKVVALPTPPADVAAAVKLERIVKGLKRPVGLVDAPDGEPRLFVVEQAGRIRILEGGQLLPQPFADLSGWVTRRGEEQGLLGLAFHPNYAKNRRLYVNYTARSDGATCVVELTADRTNPRKVAMESARQLLHIAQPYQNHNGGGLEFGADGLLYVGTGDGGGAGDPKNNGQNSASLLGKMLRIDVDAPEPVPEIIQIGLRNPWRYSFDRDTGALYIADVGQDHWEAVYVVGKDELTGLNLGWPITEGSHCFRARHCRREGLTMPVVEYDHGTGCSITGGFVYRGRALPALRGMYFYGDFCTGLLRGFRWRRGKVRDHWDWKPVLDPDAKLATLSTFGVDEQGELYLVSLDGIIWKLVPRGSRRP
jgi:glucose/arabinose dehydrogenase